MPPGRYSKRSAKRETEPHLQLLAAVAAHVDDGMLREIAAADYGMDRDAYLSGLHVLRDELVLLPRDADVPWDYEVLELLRWSRPDQIGWKPGDTGERGHWMRLFCCVALVLRDVDMPQFRNFGAINDHLGPMLGSASALDESLSDTAIPFVEWATERAADSTDRAFLALAILLLECMRPQPEEKRLLASIHRVAAQIETAWEDVRYAANEVDGWLFSLTHFNLSHDLWLPLIARYLLPSAADTPTLVSKELEALGQRLLPATTARARRYGLPDHLVVRYFG